MKVGIVTKVMDFVAENSTTLLTMAAVGGVVTTGVTSWYAAKKTKDIRYDLGEDATKGEVAKKAWPYYIAPVTICGLTIASIITLNIEHDKKYAALLGAYTLAKTDKEKLGEKVKELVGQEKADQIKESLGIKQEEGDDEPNYDIEDKGTDEKTWWIDTITGVRFWASENDIYVAAAFMADMVTGEEHPSLVDFYGCFNINDDMCPECASAYQFGLDKRVQTLKPKMTSVYSEVEHKAYRAIMYDHNCGDRWDY